METHIKWQSPSQTPPPFNTLILALIGYQSSPDFGITWEKVLDPYSVIITNESPNDTLDRIMNSQREFDLFQKGEIPFSECHFQLTDRHGEAYPHLELRSDAIMYWSALPDFYLGDKKTA
ncbi:MAG: hypothetical protein PHV02_07290 [Rhodocyclaceae bacterium]|nr:hypothetical protein [Rhodocyclaceae bacterium]